MRSNTTGYRLIVQREGRYRTAVDHATAKTGATVTHALSRPRCHRPDSFVLEGEAVLLGVEGIADFNGVHSRKLDDEVQLYSFDVLMNAGDDLRSLPLHLRKNHLAKMLRRRVDRIILNEFERAKSGRSYSGMPA